jgi:hypothetical protein
LRPDATEGIHVGCGVNAARGRFGDAAERAGGEMTICVTDIIIAAYGKIDRIVNIWISLPK